jgi:hypothetical protein
VPLRLLPFGEGESGGELARGKAVTAAATEGGVSKILPVPGLEMIDTFLSPVLGLLPCQLAGIRRRQPGRRSRRQNSEQNSKIGYVN